MQKLSKRLDEITKYLVATILLAIPLYPKFPLLRIPGTYVSIRLEDFLLAIALLVLVAQILPELSKFVKDKVNKAIFIFLLVGLISLASAFFVTKTAQVYLGILHWLRRVEYFIPFFLGIIVIRKDRKNLGFFLKVLMVSILIAFFYGFSQRHFNWPIIVTQNEEYAKGVALRYVSGGHINATFAGHYDLATFLILLLPIYLPLLLLVKDIRIKTASLAVLLSGLWLLSFSGSRISAASYLVASTLSLLLIKKYKIIPVMILISILFFSLSSNLTSRYQRLIDVGKEKIEEVNKKLLFETQEGVVLAVEDPESGSFRKKTTVPTPTPIPVFEDRSTSIRFDVEWPRAIRALTKSPLLGTGYSSITLATDNDYLRLLGEVGVLGFLAFFLIFIRIGKLIYDALPLKKRFKGVELAFIAGFTGALPAIFINAMFIDVFEASKFAIIFWLLAGFAVALLQNENNN